MCSSHQPLMGVCASRGATSRTACTVLDAPVLSGVSLGPDGWPNNSEPGGPAMRSSKLPELLTPPTLLEAGPSHSVFLSTLAVVWLLQPRDGQATVFARCAGFVSQTQESPQAAIDMCRLPRG